METIFSYAAGKNLYAIVSYLAENNSDAMFEQCGRHLLTLVDVVWPESRKKLKMF